ncbi:lipocalin family protein [Hymenobacter lucidus]|uniref:Lipocalin family protein n=1 Tax=Hymenobacter lucidus TaxID=2880930 RepID=A0ABS8AMT0_9BACT|nr:lipocalin family protein [Hymenobacter lucidus]MCB2406591.1 lipocalin family protein [Hymenobacter lucidus]
MPLPTYLKHIGLLVLLGTGLFVAWEKVGLLAAPVRRTSLLANTSWRWVSWTEKTGRQASKERILPCMQDDVIRFEQADEQHRYFESSGSLNCGRQESHNLQGQWQVSNDGQTLTITGGNTTFENNWQIQELTASRVKLAYRTTTSQGPFIMIVTFLKR